MRRALALAMVGLVLAGCGHVNIQASDPKARIYVDGVLVGRGEAEVRRRMGPPSKMRVSATNPAGTVQREVKREFTGITLWLGLATYFTGFLWAWQYPENVILMLPEKRVGGWDEEPSGWDAPPAGWEEPPALPAPAR